MPWATRLPDAIISFESSSSVKVKDSPGNDLTASGFALPALAAVATLSGSVQA